MNESNIVVPSTLIRDIVYKLTSQASVSLHPRYYEELLKRLPEEDSPNAQWVLEQLVKNVEVAKRENLPLCQDTGYVLVFIKIGEDICLPKDIKSSADEGVRLAFKDSLLRASMVAHPLNRVNTKDNTPAILHIEKEDIDGMEVDVMLKGAGSENASALKMLSPSEGMRGVRRFILQTLKKTAWNACPPLVLGIGIGGTMEKSAYLAKKAILHWAKGKDLNEWERSLREDVNKLGIGPGGVGGKLTCLGVSIETAPCHIATLPVALNVQCYAMRISSLRLSREDILASLESV
ncbi:fumarate hydratase [bacterium]|nr:fumarate hydratase [bacterium]